MQNMKTKHMLLMSIVSIMLCIAMLIGGTFAWFTDQSSTTTNSIMAGTLDIELQWFDATSNEWKSAENQELKFIDMDENSLWEPGCTYSLPKLRIKNNSNLALDYEVVIDGIHGDADLNAAIDWVVVGDMVGSLLPSDAASDEIAISAHMKEEAGNGFQGMTMDGITVTVFATQKSFESDSNGDDYDAAARAVEVSTFAELQDVMNDGGYAKLIADINAADAATKNARVYIPVGKQNAVIDLNGHTLTSKDGGGDNSMAIYVDRHAKLTIEDSVGSGKIISSCYGVYVQPEALFTMNGGALVVDGNDVYDLGVVLWNGAFVMNAGTIDAQFGVWTYNYWKDNGEPDLSACSITIADGCVINSDGYDAYEGFEDLDKVVVYEAPDTVLDLPADISAYLGY